VSNAFANKSIYGKSTRTVCASTYDEYLGKKICYQFKNVGVKFGMGYHQL